MVVDGNESCRELPAVDGVDRRFDSAFTRSGKGLLPVSDEAEGYLGMGESHSVDDGGNGIGFRHVFFEEFHSRRDVVKEVAHDDGGALGATGFIVGYLLAAVNGVGTACALSRAGQHIHLGNRRNRRQGFAAEAEGADTGEIILGAHLAGCVAQKGNRHLVKWDAAAVIGNSHIGDAAVLYLDRDGGGTCVDGIFHQFLYDRRGTLDHLSCRDKLRDVLVQYFNRHFAPSFS